MCNGAATTISGSFSAAPGHVPKVSVIVPVYKTEIFLPQCIESIINQSYKQLEIILVDDGSPDQSGKICDDYAQNDCRVKVIHKNNGGLSAARNAGMNVSTGDYLIFVDSDDYIESECISALVAEAVDIDADLVISGYIAFYEDNSCEDIIGHFAYAEYNHPGEFLKNFHVYFSTIFNYAWGKLYKTEKLKELGLKFREDLVLVEDLVFNAEYYDCCKKICILDQELCMYRQLAGTLSKRYYPDIFRYREIYYSKIEGLLKKYGQFSVANQQKLYEICSANYLTALTQYVLYCKQDNLGLKLKRLKEYMKLERIQGAIQYSQEREMSICPARAFYDMQRRFIAKEAAFLFYITVKFKAAIDFFRGK